MSLYDTVAHEFQREQWFVGTCKNKEVSGPLTRGVVLFDEEAAHFQHRPPSLSPPPSFFAFTSHAPNPLCFSIQVTHQRLLERGDVGDFVIRISERGGYTLICKIGAEKLSFKHLMQNPDGA